MKKIKAIIFDLDNTLYEEFTYFDKVLQGFVNQYEGLEYSKKAFHDFFNKARQGSKDILKDIITGFLELELTKDLHDTLYETYVSTKKKLPLYPDGKELLSELQEANYKLGLLTNGVVAAQQCKVACLRLESSFDHITYARTWGSKYEKPHQLPFVKITEALGVAFKNCLFIGDNPKTDFKVPAEKGAYTIRLLRGPNKAAKSLKDVSAEITQLTELKDFL